MRVATAKPGPASPAGRTREGARFPAKGELCGIAYSRGTLDQHAQAICDWLRGDRSPGATIGYVNPHVFNLAMKNAKVRAFLAEADLVGVDGLGVALAVLWLKGERLTRSVMTPLFDKVWGTENLPPLRAVLIGGTDEVVRLGAAELNQTKRRMEVVATCNGYQPAGQQQEFLRQHADCEVILVAMGTPRSEELILEARRELKGKLFWSIGGGTLHFHAGTQPRVPPRVSTLGLQWLWRIVHEPHLTPRYLVGTPVFAWSVLRSLFARKSHAGH